MSILSLFWCYKHIYTFFCFKSHKVYDEYVAVGNFGEATCHPEFLNVLQAFVQSMLFQEVNCHLFVHRHLGQMKLHPHQWQRIVSKKKMILVQFFMVLQTILQFLNWVMNSASLTQVAINLCSTWDDRFNLFWYRNFRSFTSKSSIRIVDIATSILWQVPIYS